MALHFIDEEEETLQSLDWAHKHTTAPQQHHTGTRAQQQNIIQHNTNQNNCARGNTHQLGSSDLKFQTKQQGLATSIVI